MDMDIFYDMQVNNSPNCADAAVNEEYQSYLIDLALESDYLLEKYPDYCYVPLGQNHSIIYFKGETPFQGSSTYAYYNRIPKCYGLMSTRELEEIGVTRVQRLPQLALRGQGVLVGIIDTGINVTNPLFVFEDGTTKIAALWDQTDQEGEHPEEFTFGTEWTREKIDEALRRDPQSIPRDENGHGTFLAAIAAGREDEESGFSGVAPDSELVVVKLKQAKQYLRDFYSIEDGIWACQEDDVMMAIRYIMRKAYLFQKPVSICIGIGTNLGGHKGTNNLARYISSASLLSGVSFQIASGNEGIAGHHYHGRMREGENVQVVDFNVAEKESGFIMELWGGAPAEFSVGLVSPGGERVERIQLKLNEFRSIRFFPEETVLEIRSYPGEIISGDQVIRMNFRKPAAGTWRLYVYLNRDGNPDFDLWLPISNFIKEDTFFLNPSSTETVTSPGDSVYGMTYVPYDVQNDSLYIRASRGYTRDGRVKPDLAAPGVSVAIPAAGRDGREIVRSGSSVAAAFGTGISALIQEWAFVRYNDSTMTSQKMRFYLIQGAMRPGAFEYPNRDWGYGIVNVYDAFLAMRG